MPNSLSSLFFVLVWIVLKSRGSYYCVSAHSVLVWHNGRLTKLLHLVRSLGKLLSRHQLIRLRTSLHLLLLYLKAQLLDIYFLQFLIKFLISLINFLLIIFIHISAIFDLIIFVRKPLLLPPNVITVQFNLVLFFLYLYVQ